jgi:hypothetical protein
MPVEWLEFGRTVLGAAALWLGAYANVAIAASLIAITVTIFARQWDRLVLAGLFLAMISFALCALTAYTHHQLSFESDFGQGVVKVIALSIATLVLSFTLKFQVAPLVVFLWQFVFDHRVSPLRHIPDVSTRHLILQILGWMWATAFCVSIGSYALLGFSIVMHSALIAAAAVTVATYTTAQVNPTLLPRILGRDRNGEHA